MSVTSCLDFKPSLHRNASFKFHSFDHAVEVNSRLLTITNTSQIYLGGGAEKHLIATCLGTVGLYYTYRTYNDNRSEAPAEIEEKHVDIKPTANRTPAQDLDMLN